ncbi:MAG: tetratricopeptide repeat protein [Anaerolineaceae bacterium]|nr:tetratricopeptide repeat protein [Anaerolineaceae bacterium]
MSKRILSLILIVVIGAGCLPAGSQEAQTTATAAKVETIKAYTPTPPPSPSPTPTPLPAVRIAAAEEFIFYGDYDQALSSYEAALNAATDAGTQAAALSGIGRAQYLRGEYAEAVQALATVAENYPDSPLLSVTYFFLAQAYAALGSYAPAAKAYENSRLSQPGVLDADLYEWQGDALAQAGDHAAAIDAYQAAIDNGTVTNTSLLQIKIAGAYHAMGDAINALRIYLSVYDTTNNDYLRAQMNFLAGQAYTKLGLPEQAHARYQDSVINYPRSYDSYSGLEELVNAGITVDEYQTGRVYYYAHQYGLAFDAFTRFMKANPDHDGSALHYTALCLREMGRTEEAVADWNKLINSYQGSPFWADAWDEKAYTEWIYFNRPKQAAETYLDYAARYPSAAESPGFLYEAGRILEYEGLLEEAAAIWVRLIDEYPSNELSYRALFQAGIINYRIQTYDVAQVLFQRAMVLSVSNADQAAAYLWIGKTQQALGDQAAANASWEQAAQRDLTGYYSERARQLLNGEVPFESSPVLDLEIDWENEHRLAEMWVRNTFEIPVETNLKDLDSLAANPTLIRGRALWELGLYTQANQEFETLRLALQQDAVNSFRLLNYLVKIGAYRPAIFTSRQILDLAGMDDATTFTAPDYFNHIRFGIYFNDLVLQAAEEEKLDPLFLFAAIRQESLFDVGVTSSAGARGLMQIMPATGEELAADLNWPPYYTVEDLFRPNVSIQLGAHYLGRMKRYFDGDLVLALAGYNGGPGNAQTWRELANEDPDLFLEVIRFSETRLYVTQIADFYNIYKRLYAPE